MTDIKKYAALRDTGASPVEMWRQAEADGVDQIARIRLVRELYGLSLVQAKAVMVEARSGETLEERQEKLVEDLEKALDSNSDSEA